MSKKQEIMDALELLVDAALGDADEKEEEKPARSRRSRRAKKDDDEDAPKPARSRRSRRAKREPDPEPEEDENEEVTLPLLRQLVRKGNKAIGKDEVQEILDEFEVKSVATLDEDDYADFYAKLSSAIEDA